MGTHVNRHLTSAVAMAWAGVITLVNVYLIYKQLCGAQLLTGSPAGAAQPRRTPRSGRNLAFVARVHSPHKIGDL
jgi:hypothetical protein